MKRCGRSDTWSAHETTVFAVMVLERWAALCGRTVREAESSGELRRSTGPVGGEPGAVGAGPTRCNSVARVGPQTTCTRGQSCNLLERRGLSAVAQTAFLAAKCESGQGWDRGLGPPRIRQGRGGSGTGSIRQPPLGIMKSGTGFRPCRFARVTRRRGSDPASGGGSSRIRAGSAAFPPVSPRRCARPACGSGGPGQRAKRGSPGLRRGRSRPR